MIGGREIQRVRKLCDEYPTLLRPFAYEGAATGFPLRTIFTGGHKERDFVRALHPLGQQYSFMYYIGIGFWCGLVYWPWPDRVRGIVDRQDPFYKYLCYDGFGFKLGLFQYLKDRNILRQFLYFKDYERNACFQGFGRSLWFLYMDAPWVIREQIACLDEPYRADCYSGVGLAVAFTNMDDLQVAFRYVENIEPKYRGSYFVGFMLAIYTRRMIDADYLVRCLDLLTDQQRAFASAGLRSCDERFREVNAKFAEHHYREWRRYLLEDLEELLSPQAESVSV